MALPTATGVGVKRRGVPQPPQGRLVLGIETGSEHLSVSLVDWRGDGLYQIREEALSFRQHRHADIALPEVARILKAHSVTLADLSLVAVGRGPGGFTGVRVGLSMAVGLTLSAGLPAWPVCSLLSLAAEAAAAAVALGQPPRPVAAAIDARRAEVYGALFRFSATGQLEETLIAPMAAHIDVFDAAVQQAVGLDLPVTWVGSGALVNGRANDSRFHMGSATRHALLAAAAFEAAGHDVRAVPPLDAAYVKASEAEINAEKALAKRLAMGN